MHSFLSRLNLKSHKAVVLLCLLAMLALVSFAIVRYKRSQPLTRQISYSEMRALSENPLAVKVLQVDDELVAAVFSDGTRAEAVVTDAPLKQELLQGFVKHEVLLEFHSLKPGSGVQLLGYLSPLLLLSVLGFVAWRTVTATSGGGSFHPADAKRSQSVLFHDVAGVDEAKAELAETIEFLRDPAGFGRLGGRAPKGILLSGPPGTGKTMLARAAANEAGVAFLSVAGSAFQEKYVGVGAQRVRKLFAEARRLAPCVVFIDEIDALGRKRGRNSDSAASESDQTLNQLLIEMDGFDQLQGVAVLASTNRPDILDSALVRPGRFDREISVNLADARGREAILAVHAKRLTLEADLDLKWIARGTPGFSGADLANMLNEAAILATRANAAAVGRAHLEQARDKVLMGVARVGALMDADERRITAVHEAGHVAMMLQVKHSDPVHKVSILPRGRALGVTQALPERDRLMKTREYLLDQIAILLGGRAAEQVLLNTMTAGASDDIERAVDIARRMVTEFGMSELGPVSLGARDELQCQSLLDRVQQATDQIVNQELARAQAVMHERRNAIEALVLELLEHDTLERAAIETCFAQAA